MKYIFISLLIIFAFTYIIGSYFLRYALVPDSGAQNRQVKDNYLAPEIESVPEIDQLIENNMANDIQLRDAWTTKMDLEKNSVYTTSHDGLTLAGHTFKQANPTDRWVILAHGYQSGEGETLLIGRHFYEKGFNVLTFCMRAHGKSEGDYIGMGYLDRLDLLSWTHSLIEKYPDSRIIYHGTSMGGATVLMASGMELPPNVKAIVSDCAYTSIWDIFSSEIRKRFNLPPFPILHMAQLMGILKAGYNFKDGNVLNFVEKSTLPILFIHTEADDFVPASMVRRLYEAKKNGEKEKLIFKDGDHAFAKYVDPVKYYDVIFNFVEKYL